MRWSRSREFLREFLVDLRIKRLELFKRRPQWDIFIRRAVDPESLARVSHERDISASRGHEACTIGSMGSPLPCCDQASALESPRDADAPAWRSPPVGAQAFR
jgi:hypothetical protein